MSRLFALSYPPSDPARSNAGPQEVSTAARGGANRRVRRGSDALGLPPLHGEQGPPVSDPIGRRSDEPDYIPERCSRG
jgi:hypothetical protein